MLMNNKLFCSHLPFLRGIEKRNAGPAFAALALFFFGLSAPARSGDAPQWMHALVNVPLPEHDEKTNAVLLLAEDTFVVQGDGKMKRIERRAYKILRPDGRRYGTIYANFDAETKINFIHGWCIPSQGKDYEVKDKEAAETALFGVLNGELMTDQKTKVLVIPAADPGNIVGYELEQEVHPYILQDVWRFQQIRVPVRESHYSLHLPAGWEYKAMWLNHAEQAPASVSSGEWQWVVTNVPAVKTESSMPPLSGVAGRMVVSLFPPGGSGAKGFENWKDIGQWEDTLERGRRNASPEIKQKVASLTASATSSLAKMQSLARFVQTDIRYVAIE